MSHRKLFRLVSLDHEHLPELGDRKFIRLRCSAHFYGFHS